MRYRIVQKIERPPKEEIARLGEPRATYVGSFVRGFGTMDPAIQPVKLGWKFCGTAVTVDLEEPDAGLPMLALDFCEPGDVLVIAARGQLETLCFGGGMCTTGLDRGLAGVVVDGAISDRESIVGRDLPVFARGTTPCHDVQYRPGSINVPVVCGGVLVSPGDVVVGSGDGVAVVRKDLLGWVAGELEAQRQRLAGYSSDLRKGQTIGQSVNARERFTRPDIIWE